MGAAVSKATSLPVNYTAARKALSTCVRVDEVKHIRDQAVAMVVYAKQAKDGELVSLATEIRERATRKLGEMMEDQRHAGSLKRGGDRRSKVKQRPLNLADQGVDKHLADRARKAAAMPEDKFEASVAKKAKIAVAAVENERAVITAAREATQKDKKAKRAAREQALAAKQQALPEKKYGVILADPEWRFEVWSRETGLDRAADNHYPTSTTEVIKSRDVPSIAADDCVLFLWATVPMEDQAHEVLRAWGFRYVSQFVWVKDKIGTGYWTRNKHELLLVGTRGKFPRRPRGAMGSVLIKAPRGHSEKPDASSR